MFNFDAITTQIQKSLKNSKLKNTFIKETIHNNNKEIFNCTSFIMLTFLLLTIAIFPPIIIPYINFNSAYIIFISISTLLSITFDILLIHLNIRSSLKEDINPDIKKMYAENRFFTENKINQPLKAVHFLLKIAFNCVEKNSDIVNTSESDNELAEFAKKYYGATSNQGF